MIVGRLAPSPTGAQHLGNARTFLLAWLSTRNQQGRLVLRIEDLDTPRVKAGAIGQAIEDLRWLGMDWDIGPDLMSNSEFPALVQSDRLHRYEEILDRLKVENRVYPCTCSRREVEEASSAPHESGLDGPVYPGTCARKSELEQLAILGSGKPFAWRFRMPNQTMEWKDGVLGNQNANLSTQLGDFVVGRSYDVPAYQLAVVVDDHDMGITEVVRGNDLIASTFRQLAIYNALQWNPPHFYHPPLIVGPDGRRLAKRHGDTRLSALRQSGIAPQTIIGYLAWTAGLQDSNHPATPASFLGRNPFLHLPSQPTVIPFQNAIEYFQSN